jgi:hypothetical protein
MASWSQTDAVGGQQAQRQVEPHPRPPKRLRASGAQEKKIRAAFEFACCTACGMRPVERHHVVPRSQSGDDVIENLCPLCHGCHTKLEGHESGWERIAAAVRVYVLTNRPRCVYVIGKIGWDRFNKRYPLQESRRSTAQPTPGNSGGQLGSRQFGELVADESPAAIEPVWRYRPPEDEPDESFAVEGHE